MEIQMHYEKVKIQDDCKEVIDLISTYKWITMVLK